ncbi:sodium:proton antiporter [Fodinisporobacter ferrooxydans]|uniref:Sodium:proton antiporter n=1 Tax=Fodinisporobacter ferrooxydans TaxID=2901836 RepID=A0ABY4CGZ4_9BACL|nr:sodium:proton antiporter [Alicyclobacillaceae bacterium MYW30-H2]
MYGTFWSILPFLIVIPLSMITRQVLPGLMVGLLVGSYMLHPSVLGGIQATLAYILKELSVSDNLRLIVFLYGFGAFVGLVRVTGGVTGFTKWMETRIHSIRGAFAVTWLSSLITFMAPDFRIITVAPVMKQIFGKLNVPNSKVAFAIDVTSTPFIALVPLGTAFVGYMVGLIATSMRHNAVASSAYHVFLVSIPFNFFSIVILLFGLYKTFFSKTDVRSSVKSGENSKDRPAKGSMQLAAENRIRIVSQFANAETASEFGILSKKQNIQNSSHGKDPNEDSFPDPVELVSEKIPPNMKNLSIPLFVLLSLTLFMTWWDGHFRAPSFLAALANANAAKAMLEALLITLFFSIVWYIFQRQPISRTMFGFLAGGNEMMGVIVLLVLVWSISAVSSDLGFTNYMERTIGHLVPPVFIAPVLFLFGCLISYVIGSSFGTWGMLLPLGFSLGTSTHAYLPLIAGAVFASGTFGGFASPLSDNTVAMATVMKLPLMQYANAKLKASILAVVVSAILYAAVGFFLPKQI